MWILTHGCVIWVGEALVRPLSHEHPGVIDERALNYFIIILLQVLCYLEWKRIMGLPSMNLKREITVASFKPNSALVNMYKPLCWIVFGWFFHVFLFIMKVFRWRKQINISAKLIKITLSKNHQLTRISNPAQQSLAPSPIKHTWTS